MMKTSTQNKMGGAENPDGSSVPSTLKPSGATSRRYEYLCRAYERYAHLAREIVQATVRTILSVLVPVEKKK